MESNIEYSLHFKEAGERELLAGLFLSCPTLHNSRLYAMLILTSATHTKQKARHVMMGLYLLALLFGYLSGVATVYLYQWLLRQLGHGPYLEAWQPRVNTPERDEDKPLVEVDNDGRVWVLDEKYAPSITWMGSMPPGTTMHVDEVKRDAE